MNLRVLCPACLSQFEIQPQYVGRRGQCRTCSHSLVIHPIDRPIVSERSWDQYRDELDDSNTNTISSESKVYEARLVADQSIFVDCRCGRRLRAPLTAQGRKALCPACRSAVEIPFLLRGVPTVASVDRFSSSPSGPMVAVNATNRTYLPRTSRYYRHSRCGAASQIDGPEFEVLSNPLSFSKRTVCGQCGDAFPISEFSWSDTEEELTQYYARHLRDIPAYQQFLAKAMRPVFFCSVILGVLLGIVVGWFLGWVAGICSVVGFSLLAGTYSYVLMNSCLVDVIAKRGFGTTDTRSLV